MSAGYRCRSLKDGDEVTSPLRQNLAALDAERRLLAKKIEIGPLTDDLIGQCRFIVTNPLRLLRTAMEDKQRASHALRCAISARAEASDYTSSLLHSLLYNRASAHDRLAFTQVAPCLLPLLGEALREFVPPLFTSDAELAQIASFYQHLFESMLGPTWQAFSGLRAFLMRSLVPEFATLWFLRVPFSLRPLRNAHNRLVREYLGEKGYELDFNFLPPPKRAPRIGFLVEGNSHGHGWPGIRQIVHALREKGVQPSLITWSEDPATPDMPVETLMIEKWEHAAEEIRALDLDLLFFCMPHDRNIAEKYEILAHHRLARRQVTAFFNNTTTSLPVMDVFITSKTMDDPEDLDRLFSENQVVTMDQLPFAFDYGSYFPAEPAAMSRADLGLPETAKIITCGNSLTAKASQDYLAFLARLLSQHSDACLVLMPGQAREDILFYRLNQIFDGAGIARDRIRIITPSSRARQYGLLPLADLYIDFFPFSGANSLFDALWSGTPCLTLATEYTMRCRQGPAILEDIGLIELVCHDLAEMEAKALTLLQDSVSIRQRLGPAAIRRCSAFDGRSACELAQILVDLAAKPNQMGSV